MVLDLHPGSHRERSGSAGQVPGVSPAGCAAALLLQPRAAGRVGGRARHATSCRGGRFLPEVQVEARLVPRQPHVEQRRRALGREVGEQVAGAAAKLVLTAVRVALPEADLPARLPRRRPSAALVHGGHALERCLAEGAARAEQVRVPSRLVKGEERRRRAHRRRRRARHKRVIVHVDHELEVGKLVRVCQLLEVVHKRYEHRRARPARRAKPPDGAVDNGKRSADGAVWQQASCLVEELRRDGAKPMQVALELRDEWPNRLGAEPSRRERLRLWPGSLHAARQSVKQATCWNSPVRTVRHGVLRPPNREFRGSSRSVWRRQTARFVLHLCCETPCFAGRNTSFGGALHCPSTVDPVMA